MFLGGRGGRVWRMLRISALRGSSPGRSTKTLQPVTSWFRLTVLAALTGATGLDSPAAAEAELLAALAAGSTGLTLATDAVSIPLPEAAAAAGAGEFELAAEDRPEGVPGAMAAASATAASDGAAADGSYSLQRCCLSWQHFLRRLIPVPLLAGLADFALPDWAERLRWLDVAKDTGKQEWDKDQDDILQAAAK